MVNERFVCDYDYDENYELGFIFKDNGKHMNTNDVVTHLNEQDKKITSLELENKLLLEEMKEIRDKLTVYLKVKGVE